MRFLKFLSYCIRFAVWQFDTNYFTFLFNNELNRVSVFVAHQNLENNWLFLFDWYIFCDTMKWWIQEIAYISFDLASYMSFSKIFFQCQILHTILKRWVFEDWLNYFYSNVHFKQNQLWVIFRISSTIFWHRKLIIQ